MIVIYIHGGCFSGGSSEDTAYKNLKKFLPEDLVDETYSLKFSLNDVEETLKDINKGIEEIEKRHPGNFSIIIGVSSGGWYVNKIKSSSFIKKILMICPVVEPFDRLEAMKNNNDSRYELFKTNTSISFKNNEYKKFPNIECEKLIIAGEKDKNVPKELFIGNKEKIIWFENGTHSMCNFPPNIHHIVLDYLKQPNR